MPETSPLLLNELPKYSKWPARLLGVEPWGQKVKSREEIDREYETESWGAYLNKVIAQKMEGQITSRQLDNWQCDLDEIIAFSQKNDLLKGSFGEAYEAFVNTIRNTLDNYSPLSSVAEFGCGFGSIILRLAEFPEFQNADLFAAEYTPSGQELTKICAKNQHVNIQVGACDFMDAQLCDLPIPEDCIIYTCAAACTLSELPDTFIESLIKFKPRLVVHFEPTYEHQHQNSLLSLMRKRYIEVNDYNKNLLVLLKKFQFSGRLNIVEEIPSVFGMNPLFPISVISWKPIR